jgi:hypothetical protein
MSTDPQREVLYELKIFGELVDELESVRIANGNRIGAAIREKGGVYPQLTATQDGLIGVEKTAQAGLRKVWRQYRLAPWAKDIPGAGEKLMSRLISVTGDPDQKEIGHLEETGDGDAKRWVIDSYEPRTVAQLWAYCGHGDPRRKRSAGMTQAELFKAGNPDAKKRVWLLATQFVKTANSPYRLVYEEARVRYKDRVHTEPCKRCGPSGKPALVGSPWNPGHQHAAALRYVGKALLKDMWNESARLRKLEAGEQAAAA